MGFTSAEPTLRYIVPKCRQPSGTLHPPEHALMDIVPLYVPPFAADDFRVRFAILFLCKVPLYFLYNNSRMLIRYQLLQYAALELLELIIFREVVRLLADFPF